MKNSTAKNRPGTQNKRCTRIKNIREHSRKAAYCQFLEKERSLIGSVERNRVLPEPDPLVSRRNFGLKSEHERNSQKEGGCCMGVFVVVRSYKL
jgi:hypothetical protein